MYVIYSLSLQEKIFFEIKFSLKVQNSSLQLKNPEMKWAFLKFEKPHCHLIETKNIIRIRTKIEYFN